MSAKRLREVAILYYSLNEIDVKLFDTLMDIAYGLEVEQKLRYVNPNYINTKF